MSSRVVNADDGCHEISGIDDQAGANLKKTSTPYSARKALMAAMNAVTLTGLTDEVARHRSSRHTSEIGSKLAGYVAG
jgi:hypothetical protein